ncbi:hypothetical protein FGG08_007312 [Glutinoglossum americanum]|uniref:Kinesin light chain n=1 Tax=Glutinoglossum americanum TaxID=1670608 RepID=A0A9P8L125_9PEZI|nr:hypothetical protein FGG08_007312 [Glutinoglossum americanum]
MLGVLMGNGVEHLVSITSVTRTISVDCVDAVIEGSCAGSGEVARDITCIIGTGCKEVVIEELKASYWEVVMEECCVPKGQDIFSKLGWILVNHLYSTLASLLRHGRNGDAEQIGRQALAGMKKIRGKNHPDALNTLDLLARVLNHLGQYQEAVKLHQKYLKRLGGKANRKALIAKCRLCAIFKKLGNYSEAKKASADVVEMCKKIYGNDHKETRWAVGMDTHISETLRIAE